MITICIQSAEDGKGVIGRSNRAGSLSAELPRELVEGSGEDPEKRVGELKEKRPETEPGSGPSAILLHGEPRE